jgi:hypothetical protein
MERRVILPIDTQIRARAIISPLQLHMPQSMEPTQFLLLLGRTMLVGESTMLSWRKPKKLPSVVLGIFFINTASEVVLFDSGASHSFISVAYVEKHNLPIALLKCQMIVSSPGRDIPARQLCPKVNLKIRGIDFVANLIVLESRGIDVILVMDWLSKHKVLIDCAKKSIKLTILDGKELKYVAEPVVTAKGVANRVKLN